MVSVNRNEVDGVIPSERQSPFFINEILPAVMKAIRTLMKRKISMEPTIKRKKDNKDENYTKQHMSRKAQPKDMAFLVNLIKKEYGDDDDSYRKATLREVR